MSQTVYLLEGEPTVARQRYSPVAPTLVGTLKPTYRVVLEKGEDNWIVAQCIEIPGAISQGKDVNEALRNITEALTAVLEATSPDQPSEFVISWEVK
jgi:predicted RNase H-like HicB family nuclease